MRRAALVVVAIFSAIVFPTVFDFSLPGQLSVARALPALSGATTTDVPNGDFSGVGVGEVGTPPANNGFETAGGQVGTPPTNNGFETGDFTGWTTSGSPTVQPGGPTGYYAQLSNGAQAIKSSPFTVATNAQTYTLKVAAQNSGTFSFWIGIWTGPTYSSVTWTYISSCPTACTNWNTYSFDAIPYRGQSIKFEVDGGIGIANVDDVGAMQETLASWAPTAGDKVSRETGGPGGAYAKTTTTITSQAYTVDANGQNGAVNVKVESASGSYDVYVLSGPTFGTSTKVFSGTQADSSAWGTKTFGLGDFTGQTVKFKIVPGFGTTVVVDQAGITRNEVPGWASSGTASFSQGSVNGFNFASHVGVIKSGTFSLDGSDYNGNLRGNWFKITYRMKYNFNSTPSDLGSTLQLYVQGDAGAWFTATGKLQGAPYDPTDVWLEKYFFVYNPSSPYSPSPRTVSFRAEGWGPTNFGCGGPGCGGLPDLASIVPVDGPGQNKTLGNPSLSGRASLPPGLHARVVTTDDGDPVEMTSGNYTQAHTDLAIPGAGIALSFTRTYSAQANTNGVGTTGPLGAKWSHNWQAKLVDFNSSNNVRISLPAGASQAWSKVSGVYVPPAGYHGTVVKNGDGSWTLTTPQKLVYQFNSSGQWTSVADRNGNTTSLAYDGSARLSTITDPGGRTLTITYGTTGNGNGRISSVSDGTRSVSYGYSAAGDLTTITDVMGGTISYAYSGHLLTQGTDAKGNVFVRNTYDAKSRVTQQLDAAGGTTTFAYDTPGAGATRIIDQRGKQTTYYFDQQMRITDVVDHDGNTTSTVYDANNNRTSVTNSLGKTWTYTYDSKGNVLTAKDPLLKQWTYTYNSFNNVLTVTDPLSRATTYAYSAGGNLTSVTDAASKVTSFTVNAQGLVTAVTDPVSHATTFGYDSYGNRTTVTNALSKTWTFAYDGFGRVTSVTDPLTHATSYTYNAGNLVLTATDALSNVTTSTYDANGNVLTVTDANSKTTTYAYNNKDQLTSMTDAASGVTSFGYDAVGNLVSKTNPRSKTTNYSYDNLSRLASETDPLSHVRSYAYDTGGRLSSRTDAKSQAISYTYNDRNELTNITYPDYSTVAFSYNDAGARTQMVDSTGTTAYSYDSLYRLTSVTFPGSRTVGYAYDDAGRRTSITYPGGTNQATYAYDNANRLASVTDWNSRAVAYAYDDAGRMTTATLPATTGIVSTYSYDNADRLTGIAHVQNGSTTIASVAYTLDAVGNRTQRVDQQGTHTYAYDNLYRLTSVTYPGPTTTSYAFDAFGNRTSLTDGTGTTSYAYDDAERLTSVTPPSPAPVVNYTWDNNGDLTARGSDSFAWDYEDRMTSATVGGTTTTFAYRGDGLRNSRTTGGNTTGFTWDINAGLPVVLDDGNQYVYGAGLESMVTGSGTYYYLADGLGSTMAIVDTSGAVQKSYTYDVYGKPTATGTLTNEFDFAGQQTDPTGLQYLRARYMDPATGTFISREPMALNPGWTGNPFTYGGSSPSNAADPSGLAPAPPVGSAQCSFARWRCFQTVHLVPMNPGFWLQERYTFGFATGHYRICNIFGEYNRVECTDEMSSQDLVDLLQQAIDDLALITIFIPSQGGGARPVSGTKGAERMIKAERWTAEEYDALKETGQLFQTKSGQNLWLRANSNGTYDWIVEGADGTILSIRKGMTQRSAEMASRAYEWPKGALGQ